MATFRLTGKLPQWQPVPMTLREYMKRHRVTYQEMAGRLGVDKSQVHRWSSGVRLPSLRVAAEISRVTNGEVTADDFLSVTRQDAA